MMIPTQCHLWQKEQVTAADLLPLDSHFEVLNTFEDDIHFVRHLLRCKDCGQLYFHDFYEWINWTGGDDSAISAFFPVESEEEARRLSQMTTLDLLQLSPHLLHGSPEGVIRWIR